ncbi:hypothetical protein A0J48_022290 [Sphaerospermopsis aphanizomenoides BCCUSP55]|nr:hypothetical protein [Sphaerospermopsis aphanizomenoides BCCUSP55]
MLLPLGYIPEFNIFDQVLEIEDYQKLENLLREDQDHPFGIEVKNYQTEKKEAYLILKVLNSDIFFSEKEKTINFIEQILVPNLQSESIASILKRYNVGLSFVCVEAVKELQNIISEQSNDKNSENGLKNIMDNNNNLHLQPPITLPNEQPSPELPTILERLG